MPYLQEHYLPSSPTPLHGLLLLLPASVAMWEFDAVANIVVDTRVLAFKTDSQATAAVGSKKENTRTSTHTDIEGRMAKLTMIYGPEASGSRNRKSHKSRAAIRSIKLLKISVGENRKWQSNGEGRSKRQSK